MREVLSDLVVVGGGPAGLSAAVYGRRAGLGLVLLETQAAAGGQMATTPDIENYPGLDRIDGFRLGEQMARQAAGLGADIVTETVKALHLKAGALAAETAETLYRAKSMILAMGARRKTLGIPGEAKFTGRGVSYCAVCDGNFFRAKPVAVIGGGETALEDALHLAGLGCSVTLIHRRETFRGSRHAQDALRAHAGIRVLTPYVPVGIEGGGMVTALRLRHAETGEAESIAVSGVFVCIGSSANTELLGGALATDETGRIIAAEDCATAIPGLFVAGDIRRKPLYQIVTAAADGAVAATGCARFVETL